MKIEAIKINVGFGREQFGVKNIIMRDMAALDFKEKFIALISGSINNLLEIYQNLGNYTIYVNKPDVVILGI